MRRLALLSTLAIAFTLPLQARTKNESYVSYDDGGTIVRTADDGRELEARVNLPVFPGDTVITNRRGRTEVRLADGNILGIDRATSVRLASVLDSYDADANDTVVELKYGHVAIDRTGDASESFRLDTDSASYFAGGEAVFAVDTNADGHDHIQVFDGEVEVRMPSRTSRVAAGESANVDDRGLYDLASDTRNSADDFERWFLARTEHYGNANSRYLDRTLAYSDEDLSEHGSWTFVSGYGWGWRPYVNAGWRPYFYGQWVSGRNGCLTWVSNERWGWVPYHYGRWAYDPLYGWFWMPGETYAPAWVYWMYAPGYIGWAPAGWYDCYRPYFDWAYRPYRGGIDLGFAIAGRVRMHDVDLRPWTFIDANTLLSNRIDRAAVNADLVKQRILRDPNGGYAAISGTPARFTRRDIQDPAAAIAALYRKNIVVGGGEVAVVPDMTPFFRRDPQLPDALRERIVRTRPDSGQPRIIGAPSNAPVGGGGLAPIGRGSVAPIGVAPLAPITPTEGSVLRPTQDSPKPSTGWRDSGGHNRHQSPKPDPGPPQQGTPKPDAGSAPATDSWRGRAVRPAPTPSAPSGATGNENTTTAPAPEQRPSERPRSYERERGSDVPRRVIDGIGGARLAPAPAPAHAAPPPEHRDSGGHHRDSGGSSGSSKPSSNSSGGEKSSSGGEKSGGEKKH